MILNGVHLRFLGVWKRPLMFVCVGATCFVVQLAVLLLLIDLGVAKPLANAIGFVTSAQLNFLLGRRLTWPDRIAGSVSMVGYHLTALLSLAVNSAVFVASYPVLGVVFGAVVAAATSAVCNYLMSAHVVFRRRRSGVGRIPLPGDPAAAEIGK